MVEQSVSHTINHEKNLAVQSEIRQYKAEIEAYRSSGDFRERKYADLMNMDILALGDTRSNYTAVWFPAGPTSDRGPLIEVAANLIKNKETPIVILNGGTHGQGFAWDATLHKYGRESISDPEERAKAYVWAGTTEWANELDKYPWINLTTDVAWTDRPGINNPKEHEALLEWLEKYCDTTPTPLGKPIRMGILCWPHQLPRQLLGLLQLVKNSNLRDRLTFYPVYTPVPSWTESVTTNQAFVETRLDNTRQEQQRLVNYRIKSEPDMASVSEYEEYLRRRDSDPLAPQRIAGQFWQRFETDSGFREAAEYILEAAKKVDLTKLPENWD